MDNPTLASIENTAQALGSATKYLGAAGMELSRVVTPAVSNAIEKAPQKVIDTFNDARNAGSIEQRKHAACIIGIGIAATALVSVATVAHFVNKAKKAKIIREHKRNIKLAIQKEKLIDRTLQDAVAVRPAYSIMKPDASDDLGFADAPGCFAILTYDPAVDTSDPAAYRDIFVGASASMLDGVRRQLSGKGNLYVHADMEYQLPMYVYFFPCSGEDIVKLRERLIDDFDADASYNIVAGMPKLD